MAVNTVFAHEIYLNIGLSTDTKPSGQTPLSTFYEYDTFLPYITYDGTNWVIDTRGNKANPYSVSVAQAIDGSLGAYAAGDVVSADDCCTTLAIPWIFAGMAAGNGGYGAITTAKVFNETENQAVQYRTILFNATPTGELRDNAANTNPLKGDMSKWLGEIAFPSSIAKGATVATTTIATPSTVGNLPIFYKCASGSTSLHIVLVTDTAYTQTATDDITITLEGVHF